MNRIPQVLLDDLRNATEFFNSVDGDIASICNGTSQIATERLKDAALALGNALIAASAVGEVPHA